MYLLKNFKMKQNEQPTKNARGAGRRSVQNAKEVITKIPFYRVAEFKNFAKRLQKDNNFVDRFIDQIVPVEQHPDFDPKRDGKQTFVYQVTIPNYELYFEVTRTENAFLIVSNPVLIYGNNDAEYYDVFDVETIHKKLIDNGNTI